MRKNKRQAWRIALILLCLILASGAILFECRIRPLIHIAAQVRCRLLAENIITTASGQCARDGFFDYGRLVRIQYDSGGRITALNTDTAQLNLLREELSRHITELLEDSRYNSASFPLGSVLGGDLFSGLGPEITVRLATQNALTTELEHDLVDAGINQTLHTLTLKISGTVTVLLSSGQTTLEVCQRIPVAQTLIFGEVPQWRLPGS